MRRRRGKRGEEGKREEKKGKERSREERGRKETHRRESRTEEEENDIMSRGQRSDAANAKKERKK